MSNNQMSFFGGQESYRISKPIRLIELFAGYGSQALALKYLGAKFEHWKICEWAYKSIIVYKDLHFDGDKTDYSKGISIEQIGDELFNLGISADYNKPMTRAEIRRLGEAKQRQIYNAIKATHNLTNVMTAKGADLEIIDKDKYEYIMTYSFPCQDLSSAGLGKGMSEGSETRSGMLWQVRRILQELGNNLPQILIMENVPQVHGTKNKADFDKWCNFLNSLGYKNHRQDMNAKNYGIPQNRERTFMVSILGDYYYDFPEPRKLTIRLKDILQKEVDEKYYLKDKTVEYFIRHTEENKEKGNGFAFTPFDMTEPNCSQSLNVERERERDGESNNDSGRKQNERQLSTNTIAKTIQTREGNRIENNFLITN